LAGDRLAACRSAVRSAGRDRFALQREALSPAAHDVVLSSASAEYPGDGVAAQRAESEPAVHVWLLQQLFEDVGDHVPALGEDGAGESGLATAAEGIGNGGPEHARADPGSLRSARTARRPHHAGL